MKIKMTISGNSEKEIEEAIDREGQNIARKIIMEVADSIKDPETGEGLTVTFEEGTNDADVSGSQYCIEEFNKTIGNL